MDTNTASTVSLPRRILGWVRSNREKSAIIGAAALLCIMIAVVCCPSPAVAHGVDTEHGITWSLRADGTLCFRGDGEIVGVDTIFLSDSDTSAAYLPEWYAYYDKAEAIDIGKDIRHVGLDSFVNFTALETLTVRGAMTELDFECIRYTSPEGEDILRSLIVWAPAESSARSYAEYNRMEFRVL